MEIHFYWLNPDQQIQSGRAVFHSHSPVVSLKPDGYWRHVLPSLAWCELKKEKERVAVTGHDNPGFWCSDAKIKGDFR